MPDVSFIIHLLFKALPLNNIYYVHDIYVHTFWPSHKNMSDKHDKYIIPLQLSPKVQANVNIDN